MSSENVELVRGWVEHYLTTGEPAWAGLHELIEVHDHDVMDAGEYRGLAGLQRWLEDWAAPWSQFSLDPQEYLDAGEHVVVVLDMTATGEASGITTKRKDAMVCGLQKGRIVRVDYYNNPEQALEQVGLKP